MKKYSILYFYDSTGSLFGQPPEGPWEKQMEIVKARQEKVLLLFTRLWKIMFPQVNPVWDSIEQGLANFDLIIPLFGLICIPGLSADTSFEMFIKLAESYISQLEKKTTQMKDVEWADESEQTVHAPRVEDFLKALQLAEIKNQELETLKKSEERIRNEKKRSGLYTHKIQA